VTSALGASSTTFTGAAGAEGCALGGTADLGKSETTPSLNFFEKSRAQQVQRQSKPTHEEKAPTIKPEIGVCDPSRSFTDSSLRQETNAYFRFNCRSFFLMGGLIVVALAALLIFSKKFREGVVSLLPKSAVPPKAQPSAPAAPVKVVEKPLKQKSPKQKRFQ